MIKIRPATADDLPAIVHLNADVQNWHAEHYPHRFKPASDAVAPYFADALSNPDCQIDLACDADRPVGYLFCHLDLHEGSPFTLPARHLQIEHIAVAATYRRQGVASRLLALAEAHAKARNCTHILLSTWAANTTAQATFDRAGLTRIQYRYAKTL